MKNKFIYLIILIIFTITVGCQNLANENKRNTSSNVELNLEKDILKIYMLDVGQGEAILIQYNNKNVLIDSSDNDNEGRMVEYLEDFGLDNIDIAIATHLDADHIGGMDNVIRNFEIEKFYMTSDSKETKTYEDVINELENQKVDIIILEEDKNGLLLIK